ncbi:hypothetical protein GGI22_002863 [Coemansia erecta]|nr:hypothetical protein GGI22_002863 [Coemansia erecta]
MDDPFDERLGALVPWCGGADRGPDKSLALSSTPAPSLPADDAAFIDPTLRCDDARALRYRLPPWTFVSIFRAVVCGDDLETGDMARAFVGTTPGKNWGTTSHPSSAIVSGTGIPAVRCKGFVLVARLPPWLMLCRTNTTCGAEDALTSLCGRCHPKTIGMLFLLLLPIMRTPLKRL